MTGPGRTDARSPLAPGERLNLAHRRYHRRDVHPQVTNAVLHLGLARRAARRRADGSAQREYRCSLRCWRRANAEQPGRWRRELRLVAQEYVAFSALGPAEAVRFP